MMAPSTPKTKRFYSFFAELKILKNKQYNENIIDRKRLLDKVTS